MPFAALADVVAMDLPAEHAEVAHFAVESCNLVLGAGRCRLAATTGPEPTWYATVTWEDNSAQLAHVEMRHAAGSELSVRQIEFSAEDQLNQRYKALGLLIVSHVIAEASREPPAQPAEPQGPVPLPPPPVGYQLGVDWMGGISPGVEADAMRYGGFVRPWFRVTGNRLSPFVKLGWSTSSERADARWLVGGAGVAFSVTPEGAALHGTLRFGMDMQHVALSAESPDGRAESASIVRYGGQAGAELGVRIADGVSLVGGLEVELMLPPLSLDVEGRRAGRQAGVDWGAVLGLRLHP